MKNGGVNYRTSMKLEGIDYALKTNRLLVSEQNDYDQDIAQWLKKREHFLPDFRRQSPQLKKRRKLIDWTTMVAEKLELSTCTVHLAIKLLDLFMDGHDIQNPQLYLVCLVSILLASKMEEKDDKIPKCSKLNTFVKNQFPKQDFCSLEFVMLKFFNWSLGMPTACNFAEIWLPYAIQETDSHNNGPIVSYREARSYFNQYVKYFLDLSLADPHFIDVPPSQLGASLLASARIAFGLTPVWPTEMTIRTGFSLDVLRGCTDILLHTFRVDGSGEKEREDEGYQSLIGSPDKQMDSSCPELMET